MSLVRKIAISSTLLAGCCVPLTALAGGPGHLPELLPPSSNPGECYARVKIPAVYDENREGVIVQEAHTELQVTQPRLQSRQENIMTKEASTRFKVRQPSYRSVTEKIMTRPAYDKLSVSKPQFSTVQEQIQTSAPRLVWKKGNPGELRRQGYIIRSTADGRPQNYYNGGHSTDQSAFYGAGLGGQECGPGCEIWCLVEEPGERATISRRVMTSPGGVQRHPVAAQYQTIHKQVVSDPGGVEQIHVPAEYRSVTVQDIVDPGGVREIPMQAEYASVGTKTLISPERYEWRRVLCAPGTGSGTGTMPSSHYSSSSYGSGGAYPSGSSYQSGQTYGSSAHSYGATRSYSSGHASSAYGTGYSQEPITGSQKFGVFQGPSSGEITYDQKTGYYGTEDYPAYHQGSRKMKRQRRRSRD